MDPRGPLELTRDGAVATLTIDRAAALDDLLGQADQARLVGQRVADRTPDPEARVGLEVRAAQRVVAVDGLEQSERSLLHEVVHRDAEVAIAERDRAHGGEVRGHEAFAGASVAVARGLEQMHVVVDAAHVCVPRLRR